MVFTRTVKDNVEFLIPSKEIASGYISLYSPCRDIEISFNRMNLSRPMIINYADFNGVFETTYCMEG